MDAKFQRLAEQAIKDAEQAAFWGLVLSAIGTALLFWMLYLTIRAAVRDGMRDAQKVERRPTIARERDRIEGPEIRTD